MNVSSSEISFTFIVWCQVQGYVGKNHRKKIVYDFFNDNILLYRFILKRRQKQTYLYSFLVRHVFTDSENGSSAKTPRRIATMNSTFISKVIMERDPFEIIIFALLSPYLTGFHALRACRKYMLY